MGEVAASVLDTLAAVKPAFEQDLPPPGGAGPRLLDLDARPDVLARAWPSQQPQAGNAAAHQTHATLMTRDGEAWLAIGTPGGDQQDQWPLAVLLRHLHHGLDLQAAIDLPMFTSRHFPQSCYPRIAKPGRLLVEDRFGPEIIAALRRRGHGISVEPTWSLGRVYGTGRHGGFVASAATPRLMQAYAVAR